MKEIRESFEKVFDIYQSEYEKIFNLLYPAKNSTGFTERNLSVNFCRAYEQLNPSAVSWYEFQFGAKNNLHYDAIIIDPDKKKIMIIESKRFDKPSKKIQEVFSDISRVNDVMKSYRDEFLSRIQNCSEYFVYGIILADVWTETKRKTEIFNAFKEENFVMKMLPDNCSAPILPNATYFVNGFLSHKKYQWISENYKLISMVWEIGEFQNVSDL